MCIRMAGHAFSRHNGAVALRATHPSGELGEREIESVALVAAVVVVVLSLVVVRHAAQ